MNYEDLDLRTSTDTQSVPLLPRPEQAQRTPLILAAVIVVLVAVTGYLIFRPAGTVAPIDPLPASQTGQPPATETVASDAAADPVVIPPLDESDEVVRGLVRTLSANPAVAAWLTTDDLVRNFTTVVSNIAAGQRASGLVKALKPATPFAVEEHGEELFIDPQSYSRFLPLATAASSVDPAGAARLYATLKPRIDEAYAELGFPDTPFDATLERAIVLLVHTPIPVAPVAVAVKGGTAYRFLDPALEKLTSSQKLLIRMGPDNQRAIQTSLHNIGLALGIPEARLQ